MGQTASAEPQELYIYSNFAVEADSQLQHQGERLRDVLEHFQSKCREADMHVSAQGSGSALSSYGADCLAFDAVVGEVGQRFARADGQQSVGALTSFGQGLAAWHLLRAALKANLSASFAFFPGLAVVAWLAPQIGGVLRHISGRSEQVAELPANRPEPMRDSDATAQSGEPTVLASSKPQSPLGSASLRYNTKFGTYSDGTLHSGVDIEPDPEDPNKDYAVNPIGPGKVLRVGTQTTTDAEGYTIVVGYGNYAVLEHRLADGTTVYSRYAHLKTLPELVVGKEVSPEDAIAIMGTTGNSSGTHVHLEVYNGRAQSLYYGGHTPDEKKVDDKDGRTWGEIMRDGYYDPESVIDGTMNWEFQLPRDW